MRRKLYGNRVKRLLRESFVLLRFLHELLVQNTLMRRVLIDQVHASRTLRHDIAGGNLSNDTQRWKGTWLLRKLIKRIGVHAGYGIAFRIDFPRLLLRRRKLRLITALLSSPSGIV